MRDRSLHISLLLGIYFFLPSPIVAAPATKIEVISASPNCKPHSWQDSVSNVTTYCDDADASDERSHYGIAPFRTAIGPSQADEILVGMWAFSHPGWADAICSIITVRTSVVRIALDRGVGEETHDSQQAERVAKCGRDMRLSNVSLDYFGQSGDFLAYHPKFVSVRLLEGKAVTWVSTGNLTKNSQFNFDIGLLISEGSSHPFHDWHACLMTSLLDENGRPIDEYRASWQRYTKCRESLTSDTTEGVTPFALPFDKTEVVNRIAMLLGGSSRVSVAVQGADSIPLRNMFLAAANDGVKLRFLRDDDLAYAAGFGELMNDPYERDVWQNPILDAGADIRYVMTNHHDSKISGKKIQGNFLHLKTIIFERNGKNPIVLFGSANLTSAAFGLNVENVYFIENKAIIDEIMKSYDELWGRSQTLKGLPFPDRRPSN